MSRASLRQWTQHVRRERFRDTCQRLELELHPQMRTPRRHLDTLLDLADLLLDGIVGTNDGWVVDGRIRLAALRRQVESRGLAANDVRSS
mgnify:CR=1 FL=1